MIKVAVVGTRGFPGVQGGVESHCEHLYPHLVKLGCEVTVFARKPYLNNKNEFYEGIKFISLNCPRNKFLEAIVHTFKSVLASHKLHPDILHIHAIGPSFFAPMARMLGMRVIVTNHGPDYERKKWPLPAKMFLRFCERMGMTYANEIITIANNIADDVREKYGRDSSVIPNGVEITSLLEKEDILAKYELRRHKYILAVGRFVPEKGFDVLIKAFNQCKFDRWKLVIVGNADHEDIYSRELKAQAGKNENIILTGFLSGKALQQLYSHAGLFVIPSYYEGLPIVLLEAISYGLSCIASDIPANRNVDLGGNRYFKTGEVNSLAGKMKEYIAKPWQDEDRKKQIDMIAEKYNWGKIADETLKVYEKCLG